MGESFGAYTIGADEAVFPFITSANIACGLSRRRSRGDAHDDREGRGARRRRRRAPGIPGSHRLRPPEHGRHTGRGIRPRRVSGRRAPRLRARGRVELQHVKAHGALYNMAAAKRELAAAIARAVRDVDRVAGAVRSAREPSRSAKGEGAAFARRARRSPTATTCPTARSSHAAGRTRTCMTRTRRCGGRSAWCAKERCARWTETTSRCAPTRSASTATVRTPRNSPSGCAAAFESEGIAVRAPVGRVRAQLEAELLPFVRRLVDRFHDLVEIDLVARRVEGRLARDHATKCASSARYD